LEPYKADNTLQGSINLAKNYRQGFDSVQAAASQLADLAGLQASVRQQLTGGSSRALRFYIDRRQHVPRLPGRRQVLANKALPVSPGTVRPVPARWTTRAAPAGPPGAAPGPGADWTMVNGRLYYKGQPY